MLQFLLTPAVAVLTFLVGTATLGITVQENLFLAQSNESSSMGGGGGQVGTRVCGNRFVEMGEQCDDGNGDNDDGCTTQCLFPRCGDEMVQGRQGEECDEGLNNGPSGECSLSCRKNDNDDNVYSCGNGIVEGSEECDDGNSIDNDECSIACTKNTQARCGDGTMQQGEECDDGNGNNDDSCSNACKYARCGDNIVQQPQEECDDGNQDNIDNCTNFCRKARCGDNIYQPNRGEECDQGELNGLPGYCTYECKKPASTTVAVCGNGIVEGNEQCDDGNIDNSDSCSISCKNAYCGDNVVQSNEECDFGNDNGKGICSSACKKMASTNNQNGQPPPPPPPPSSISNSQGQASSQSVRLEDDFLKKQMEEALKKAQEDERMLRERMKKNQERGNQGSGNNGGNGNAEQEQHEFLGCFDAQGQWTRDREQCDHDQRKRMQENGDKQIEVFSGQMQTITPPPEQTIPEQKVQEEIRKKLLGDDIAEQQRMELLNVLKTAKNRVDTLAKESFAPEVTAYLQSAIGWLDQGIQYFSVGPGTAEEIRLMNEPIRTLMDQIGTLVASQKQLPKEKPQIDPIVVKTEQLLGKFRGAFVALVQSGIGLDQEALQAYIDAAERFSEIKGSCIEAKQNCGDLNDVLEKLKTARPWLEDQLNAHPEVAKKAGL